ncbi:MAG TPA: hypothetical protein VGN12_27185 [Pirellulales bacterium]
MPLSPETTVAGHRGKWTLLFVAALLACYVGLGLTASTRKSQTGDEGAHLTGGVSYWAFNDYRIQPENGNWPQRLCGLPVWLAGYQFPSTESANWRELKQWDVAEQFFYVCGNDVDRMLFDGRAMTAILGVALGLLVFAWSRRLFGLLAGFLSLTLFAFSPTMLTHGFLITSDMASALFFTASVAALWRLVHRVSAVSLAACWFVLSGLFLSKFAAPMIVPIGGLIVAVRLLNAAPLRIEFGTGRAISGRLRQVAMFASLVPVLIVGVAGTIWASYGFRYEMLNPGLGPAEVAVPWDGVETKSNIANQLLSAAREWRLLPEGYLYGFSHVLHFSESRSAFLNGEYRRFGWLSFFPYCFAYKTPLALLGCLALAVAAAWRFPQQSNAVAPPELADSTRALNLPSFGGWLYPLVPLVALVTVYWAFALVSHLNIGHRHLLPTYPALFIMAGAAAWWIFPPQRNPEPSIRVRRRGFVPLARVALAVCLLWSVVDGLWIWPNYLAYFNPLVGGPWNGYRHLVDSSLDWSQDLKGVKAWLDAHPIDARDTQQLYFGFYGAPPPSYYGIQAKRLPSFPEKWEPHVPEPLTGGTYLVSATVLPGIVLLMPGRWNEEFETRYQNLRKNVDVYRQLSATAEGQQQLSTIASPDEWQDMFRMYEAARFSRLASFLRQREPDDEIGYSILVYRLTDADIANALDGPPMELLEMPEAQSEDLRREGPRLE